MAKWVIDPDHTVAAFSIQHFMINEVRGQFNGVRGAVDFSESDLLSTALKVEIETRSLITGIRKRDDHLRSPDFFEIERFPLMTFESHRVEPISLRRFTLTGLLSLHGVERPLEVEAEYTGQVKGPEEFGGETSLGMVLTGRLNREEFGLSWNRPMPGYGTVVGKEVRFVINIEADLAEGEQ